METHQKLQLCNKWETVEFSPRKSTEARTDRDKSLIEAKVSEKKRSSKDSGDTTHGVFYSRVFWSLIIASSHLIVSLFFSDNKLSC